MVTALRFASVIDAEIRTVVASALVAGIFALAQVEVFALMFSVVALIASLTALVGQRKLEAKVAEQQEVQAVEVAQVAEQRATIEEQLRDGDGV